MARELHRLNADGRYDDRLSAGGAVGVAPIYLEIDSYSNSRKFAPNPLVEDHGYFTNSENLKDSRITEILQRQPTLADGQVSRTMAVIVQEMIDRHPEAKDRISIIGPARSRRKKTGK